jgi:DNA-binding SARP family transcriptional activator
MPRQQGPSGNHGRPAEIGVLGPLTIRVDGSEVVLSAPKPRGVLELLAVRCGQVVGVGDLIGALWGDDSPPSAPSIAEYH